MHLKFINFNISSLICLFLILIIGVSHGSLDHEKGKKLFKILNIKSISIFYLSYILISILVIFIWIIIPSISLIIFLAVASYHFGKEDTQFLISENRIWTFRNFFGEAFLFSNFLNIKPGKKVPIFHFVPTNLRTSLMFSFGYANES